MLSRALLVLGVARVFGFASIRKIDGARVGTEAQSATPEGVDNDPNFCTNIQLGLLTQVDPSQWCGSLSEEVCGDSYTKVKSFRIEPSSGYFNGCIWNPLEGTSGKCVYSQVFYQCHPKCQGGAGNLTMDWPSPPPPPSPSPPARRELDAITAGRSLQGSCAGNGCPEMYTGPGECENGWSKVIGYTPKCNGNQKIKTITCTEGVTSGCNCQITRAEPVNHQCIDVVGNYWEKGGTGFVCCLSENSCPPS